jgi:thymidylate synthase
MPSTGRCETCGQAWLGLLRHVWTLGEAGLDERGPIIEAPPRLFEIATVSPDDPILREYGKRRLGTATEAAKSCWAGRLREFQGVDQLRWVVEVLRARPWSTRAWISLTVPGDRPESVPDLVGLGFRIHGTRLIMTAVFRAQDALTGHLGYVPLRAVQQEAADRLGLPAGPFRVIVDMPYIYVADADRVAAILAEAPGAEALGGAAGAA